MKKIAYMPQKMLRAAVLMLCATLLLTSLFCLSVSAFTTPEPEGGVEWIMMDEDHSKMKGDGVVYERVTLPADCRDFTFSNRYVYMNPVKVYGSQLNYGEVSSSEKGGYLVRVQNNYGDGEVSFYYRSDMMAQFQYYAEGRGNRYVLRDPMGDPNDFDTRDGYYDVSIELVESLKNASKSEGYTVNVTDLQGLGKMELRHMDPSGMLTTLKGVIYAMPDGTYAWMDYATLDNSHFDADGYFSYRSGQVTVYDMGTDFMTVLEQNAGERYQKYAKYTFEFDELALNDPLDGMNSSSSYNEGSFMALMILVGYLLPIAPFVVALVFARSPKMSHPKRWYMVAGMAVLWILLAILLTVLLLM